MSLTWQKLSSLVMMYKDSSGTFFFLCNMACQNTIYLKFYTCDLKKFYSKITNVLPMVFAVVVADGSGELSLLLFTVF